MNELVVAFILLVTAFLFSLEIRRRRLAEARLQETLASVEQQVADRTEALSAANAARAEALEKAERALQVAEEAGHLKDEFLATASHELRTPLNAIVGWVHVLQTGALQDEAQRRQAVSAIDRNARIQTRLVEDLLDVSRLIQGRIGLRVSPLDLRSTLEAAIETIRPAAAAKSIAIAVDSSDEVLPVIGDGYRLHQVTWNLLANAVKYTPRGGSVKVKIERDGERATLSVTDTGEGIDPQFLPHVFEPFRQGASTTMRSGLGLGLAIVRRLVDLHGGVIRAESEGRGRGATFSVTLPLARGAAVTDGRSVKADPYFERLHVLVAEDDPDSAAALTAILKLHGCETQVASTADECLRLAGKWAADVLVCDLGLPDEDGYELLRRLRETPAGERLPAIALTAYTRPEDRAKALQAGFRAHLSKPLDPESLLREIASAVKPAA